MHYPEVDLDGGAVDGDRLDSIIDANRADVPRDKLHTDIVVLGKKDGRSQIMAHTQRNRRPRDLVREGAWGADREREREKESEKRETERKEGRRESERKGVTNLRVHFLGHDCGGIDVGW